MHGEKISQSVGGLSHKDVMQAGHDINIYPSAPPPPPPASRWVRIDADFIDTHQDVEDYDLSNYLEGADCTWGLVIQDKIVNRPMLDTLLDALRTHNAVALLGPGAEGKTTLLMQAAVRMSQEGWTVFYDDAPNSGDPDTEEPSLFPVPPAEAGAKTLYIVDNVPFRRDSGAFLRTAGAGQRVLVAGRKNEWNQFERKNRIPRRNITELETEATTSTEADAFAQYLTDTGRIANTPEAIAETRTLFLEKSNGSFYAAMLMTIKGKQLEEIAGDILWNIEKPQNYGEEPPPIMKQIACLCMVESLGLKMPKRMYAELLKRYGLNALEVNQRVEREIRTVGGYVETRHPVISGLFAAYIEDTYFFDREAALSDFLSVSLGACAEEFLSNSEARELIKAAMRACVEYRPTFDYIFGLFAELPQPPQDMLMPFLNVVKDPSWLDRLCRQFYEKHFQNGRGGGYAQFWLKWGKVQEQRQQTGDIAQPFTAQWVYHQGVRRTPEEAGLWLAWGALEEREDNLGVSCTDENTARWIYRQGTLKAPTAPNLWLAWGALEERKDNLGGVSCKDENTARWIYRQGTLKATDASIWLVWGALEERENNLGGVSCRDENTARWIYRQGTLKAPTAPNLWLAWGALEEREDNLGGVSCKDENTARWIYRQGTLKAPTAPHLWLAWGALKEREDNLGVSCKDENTARWIYRQGTLKAPNVALIWQAWSNLELTVPNRLRGFDTPYSAEWIAENGYRNSHNVTLLQNAVCLAIANQEDDKGRELLSEYRQGAEYIRRATDNARRDSDYDPYRAYTLNYAFLICFRLLGMEAEADAIREAFAEAGVDMEQVKAREMEYWTRYPVYTPLLAWLRDNP
ncbi:MAG: hypothetical protein IKO14_04460 [Oscillibacter sp.]|nr:hypothetical protein [Oscillibacter sp.]